MYRNAVRAANDCASPTAERSDRPTAPPPPAATGSSQDRFNVAAAADAATAVGQRGQPAGRRARFVRAYAFFPYSPRRYPARAPTE